MLIAFAGHSGFIGSKVKEVFSGHQFVLLERDDLYGNPADLADKMDGAELVMNFAGNNISKRWTRKRKKEFVKSRVTLTENLVKAINSMKKKPKYLVNSSAIGIYEFNQVHTEEIYKLSDSELGDLVIRWEAAANKVTKEVKLLKLRLGMVLGREGGAFPHLLKLFRKGLGGKIAGGKQVYSFIHIDDVCGALLFLTGKGLSGTYNFTSPCPVSNAEFTRILASKLKRKAFFSVPGFVIRIVMGKAADLVCRGQTVLPKRLSDEGYKFTFATIDDAFDNLLV